MILKDFSGKNYVPLTLFCINDVSLYDPLGNTSNVARDEMKVMQSFNLVLNGAIFFHLNAKPFHIFASLTFSALCQKMVLLVEIC